MARRKVAQNVPEEGRWSGHHLRESSGVVIGTQYHHLSSAKRMSLKEPAPKERQWKMRGVRGETSSQASKCPRGRTRTTRHWNHHTTGFELR